jgi:hypothetical protein
MQYYDLSQDTGECTCKAQDGKLETLTVLPAEQVISDSSQISNLNLTLFQAFNYDCTLSDAIWTESKCVNQSKTFFNINNLTVNIDQTTTILLFFLRMNHTGSYNMTDDCIKELTSQFVIMSNMDGSKPNII